MPTPHSAARCRLELALEAAGTLIRKTSLQDRTDDPLRSGKRADKTSRLCFRETCSREPARKCGSAYRHRRLCPRASGPFRYSERSSLHDVRYHASRRSTHDCSRVHGAMKANLFSLRTRFLSTRPFESPPALKLRRATFAERRLARQPKRPSPLR